jgi:CRISPR-associated endonuclease/helicase Cas3
VICTATQPAIRLPDFKNGLHIPLENELAPNATQLHRALRRTTQRIVAEMSDNTLVEEISAHEQALVIVNSRAHALKLYELATTQGLAGLIHLTTRQTAFDRRAILADIRERLRDDRPCRVIATSLVEAGVDLDFPRVWRAEAGLEQIAQAAGRCNREGKRAVSESIVTIFTPAEARPPPEIEALTRDMKRIRERHRDDLLSPSAIDDYFSEVYWRLDQSGLDRISVRDRDGRRISKPVLGHFLASGGKTEFAYRTVAESFRMIDEGMKAVIVPSSGDADATLADLHSGRHPVGQLARRLQPHLVQTPFLAYAELLKYGRTRFVAEERFGQQFCVLQSQELYSPAVGLLWEQAARMAFEQV